MYQFPYTNFHDLDLDWLINQVKDVIQRTSDYQENIDNITPPDGSTYLAIKSATDASAQTVAHNEASDTVTTLTAGLSEDIAELGVLLPQAREIVNDAQNMFSFNAIGSTTDLDDLTSSGWTMLSATGTYTNQPWASGRRLIIVYRISSSYICQIAYKQATGEFATRTYHDGGWDAWALPYTTLDTAITNLTATVNGHGSVITSNRNRITNIESLAGVVVNDFTIVVGGSVASDGTDTTSNDYSRIEYLDVSNLYSLTLDPGTLGYYMFTYSATYQKLNSYGWSYEKTTYNFPSTVKYVRIVMRSNPPGSPQSSPTVGQIIANLQVISIPKSEISNDTMRMNFAPASSTRYVYAKGKMWERYWNTLPAVKAAGEESDCWAISVDVRHTLDDYLVCFHDSTVIGQTDAVEDAQIEELTWSEVQDLNIIKGVWDVTNNQFVAEPNGATGKIPLLSDAMDMCRRYGKVLLIETKAAGSTAIGNIGTTYIDTIYQMLKDRGMLGSCGFICPTTTREYIESHYPGVFMFRLVDGSLTSTVINSIGYNPNVVVGAYNSALTTELITLAHNNGTLIVGYVTRSSPATDYDAMVEKNLDGIFLFRDPPDLT